MSRYDWVKYDYVLLLDTDCSHCESCSLLSKQLLLLEPMMQIPGQSQQWETRVKFSVDSKNKVLLLMTLYMFAFYTSPCPPTPHLPWKH